MDKEKIFAKLVSDKGLVSKIYKEFLKTQQYRNKQCNLKVDNKSKQTPHQRRCMDSK